jgi:predicted DNA-binding protein
MRDFTIIEQRLRELSSKISPNTDSPFVKEAQEYIDVDEYGLALEMLVHGLLTNGRQMSSDEIELATNIAVAMGMDIEALCVEARAYQNRTQTV